MRKLSIAAAAAATLLMASSASAQVVFQKQAPPKPVNAKSPAVPSAGKLRAMTKVKLSGVQRTQAVQQLTGNAAAQAVGEPTHYSMATVPPGLSVIFSGMSMLTLKGESGVPWHWIEFGGYVQLKVNQGAGPGNGQFLFECYFPTLPANSILWRIFKGGQPMDSVAAVNNGKAVFAVDMTGTAGDVTILENSPGGFWQFDSCDVTKIG